VERVVGAAFVRSAEEKIMPLADADFGRYLNIHLFWAREHRWQRGQVWNWPPLPAYTFWMVRRGRVKVNLEGKDFELRAGDAWLHAPVREREIRVLQDAEWYTLGITATLYENIDALAPLSPTQWKPRDSARLEGWLEELIAADTSPSPNALLCDGLARAVVGWCWEELGEDFSQFARRQVSPWLACVLETMHRSPEMTIEQHIRDSGYSPAQFRRNFHQVLGRAPRDYLLRHRLETARRLLETSEDAIAEVAARAGFVSPAHFTRLFGRAYGVAPSQYRRFTRQPKM
jgi:AraC-like DNA-binding protein